VAVKWFPERTSWRHGSALRFKPDLAVNRMPQPLLTPELSLRHFHRNVPEKELDLLKFSACGMAGRKCRGIVLCWSGMRIDPKGLIGGCSALVVRKTLRYLRVKDQWGVADLEKTAALASGTGQDLVKALQAEGLIESSATGAWSVTQAGRTFSVATAAKPVTRATAEKALAQFLDRVEHVNRDPHFLGENILDGWLITGHRHQQILLPRPMWRSRNECRRLFGFEIAVSITARSSEL
jgi:hypothetical protein